MDRCDFQNQWMKEPCNRKTLNDGGEPFCIVHGTRKFVVRAWDIKGMEDSVQLNNNTGSRWSEEEIVLLTAMEDDGFEIEDIATALNRTPNAVYYKIWSMRSENKNKR